MLISNSFGINVIPPFAKLLKGISDQKLKLGDVFNFFIDKQTFIYANTFDFKISKNAGQTWENLPAWLNFNSD